MEPVLDAPVSSGQGEECLGIGVLGGQAGDVVAEVDLGRDDLPAADDEPVALDATDLAQVGPGCPVGARAADIRVLLGVGQRPEHPDLSTPVAHLRCGIQEPTDAPTPLGELTLEPAGWGRHARRQPGGLALDPHPGGKGPLRHRQAARAGYCRSGRGSRHDR